MGLGAREPRLRWLEPSLLGSGLTGSAQSLLDARPAPTEAAFQYAFLHLPLLFMPLPNTKQIVLWYVQNFHRGWDSYHWNDLSYWTHSWRKKCPWSVFYFKTQKAIVVKLVLLNSQSQKYSLQWWIGAFTDIWIIRQFFSFFSHQMML